MSRFIALSSSHAYMFSGYFSNVRCPEGRLEGLFETSPYLLLLIPCQLSNVPAERLTNARTCYLKFNLPM